MLYTESIHWFYTVFFFIFGSLLGSFSNVVVLRMAISKSVIFPPSACPKCDHRLHAIDLIPIFSWLSLKGKCRYCKAPISIQYPLVESFMAIILCFSFYKTGPGLPFICLSSGMAIWFVISTIFIRNEVIKHQPFVWAIVYTLVLKYFLEGKAIFDNQFFIILGVCLLVGIIGCLKNTFVDFTRWFCLAFLPMFYLPKDFMPYLAGFSILISVLYMAKVNTKKVMWLFYISQLLLILGNIYLNRNLVNYTLLPPI